jgi:hypothetical protein
MALKSDDRVWICRLDIVKTDHGIACSGQESFVGRDLKPVDAIWMLLFEQSTCIVLRQTPERASVVKSNKHTPESDCVVVPCSAKHNLGHWPRFFICHSH